MPSNTADQTATPSTTSGVTVSPVPRNAPPKTNQAPQNGRLIASARKSVDSLAQTTSGSSVKIPMIGRARTKKITAATVSTTTGDASADPCRDSGIETIDSRQCSVQPVR